MSGVSSFGHYAPTVNVGGSRRLFLVNISNASYLSLVKRLFRFDNKKNPQQRYEQYLKKGEKQQKNQTGFFYTFPNLPLYLLPFSNSDSQDWKII